MITDRIHKGSPITVPVFDEICHSISRGIPPSKAVAMQGFTLNNLEVLCKLKPALGTVLEKVQGEYISESLNIISQGKPGWQGRAWILERVYRQHFALNQPKEKEQDRPTKLGRARVLDLLQPTRQESNWTGQGVTQQDSRGVSAPEST